jgi:hypothetical protein
VDRHDESASATADRPLHEPIPEPDRSDAEPGGNAAGPELPSRLNTTQGAIRGDVAAARTVSARA